MSSRPTSHPSAPDRRRLRKATEAIASLLLALGLLAAFRLADAAGPTPPIPASAGPALTPTPTAQPLPAHIRIETWVAGTDVPIALVWGADGRLYHTEKNLHLIQVRDASGALVDSIPIPLPAGDVKDLYGLALDPDFPAQPLFYVFYTHAAPLSNRVLRFRYANGVASDPFTLFSAPLPGDCLEHNGGKLAFGQDGALTISFGENCIDALAQDMTIPQGKILRISPTDGSALPDNPFYDGDGPNDDRIWALGVRNPFGLTIDPATGNVWESENGPGCGDEVNHIVAGANYGWPLSSPSYFECIDPGPPYLPPAWAWTPTIAPTGLNFYSGYQLWGWHGDLLMCAWRTGRLYRFGLDASRTRLATMAEYDIQPATCKLDVVTGPDGSLYLSARDEKAIYRLTAAPLWLPLLLRG